MLAFKKPEGNNPISYTMKVLMKENKKTLKGKVRKSLDCLSCLDFFANWVLKCQCLSVFVTLAQMKTNQ